MKQIWSPWRMKYIEKHSHASECIFCAALKQPDSEENLVVYRGQLAFVIMNRFPYTSGHLMVVPYAHEGVLEKLSPEIRAELMELSSKSVSVLKEAYHPQAFNLGINIGAAAGAGVVGHIHIHVVPRWGGDANFMTCVAETRVIPETLEDTYVRLSKIWSKRAAAAD